MSSPFKKGPYKYFNYYICWLVIDGNKKRKQQIPKVLPSGFIDISSAAEEYAKEYWKEAGIGDPWMEQDLKVCVQEGGSKVEEYFEVYARREVKFVAEQTGACNVPIKDKSKKQKPAKKG